MAIDVTAAPYNAVGDGTTDVTAAINSALATGQDVYVPGSTSPYIVSSPLLYGASEQRLFGDGYGSSEIRGVACTGAIVDSNGKNTLMIDHMKLSGQATTQMLKWNGHMSVMRDVKCVFDYQGETERVITNGIDASNSWGSIFDNVWVQKTHPKNSFNNAVYLSGDLNAQVWTRFYTSGQAGFETGRGILMENHSFSSRAVTFINPVIQAHKIGFHLVSSYCGVTMIAPYTEGILDYSMWLGGGTGKRLRTVNITGGTLEKPIYAEEVESLVIDSLHCFQSGAEPLFILKDVQDGFLRGCRSDKTDNIRDLIAIVPGGQVQLQVDGPSRPWATITEPTLP